MERFDKSCNAADAAGCEFRDKYIIVTVLFKEAKVVECDATANNAEIRYYFRLVRDTCDAFTAAAASYRTAVDDHIRVCRDLRYMFANPTWRIPRDDDKPFTFTMDKSVVDVLASLSVDEQPSPLLDQTRRIQNCVKALDGSIAARERDKSMIEACESAVKRKRKEAVVAMAKYSDDEEVCVSP